MILLSPENTIQASPAMVAAVASIRGWADRESRACLVIGPPGAGKSHLLIAAAKGIGEPLVMPPPDGTDCSRFIEAIRSGTAQWVIADDLDRFPKGLREDVIRLAASSGHQLLLSATEVSQRLSGFLQAKYSNLVIVSLQNWGSRKEDVRHFVIRWAAVNKIAANEEAIRECSDFCCASGLPRGFSTVEAFLRHLAEADWEFNGPLPAATAASAYREAISPPPLKPVILVEGYTDRIYIEWQLRGLSVQPEIEVQDCDSASRVAEQAIALRNQGRNCVAILDSDNIGKRLRKQLMEFRHPVVSVPLDAVNLPKSAYDHVQQVAEIEDLLPAAIIERFLTLAKRQPELEIRAPTGVRYVIGESDKRELALWVVEEVEREAVPGLSKLFMEALALLDIRL